MIAFKYHLGILLITLIRVQSASIRHQPARETVVDYVYEIRDDPDPIAPVGAEAEAEVPGADYDWKKYQEQELIFAPGSADELRVRPDGTATFTQPEIKRFHRTTGNGAEEELPRGLDRALTLDNNGRASGNLAEASAAPKKPDNSVLKQVTPTQPERVKRAKQPATTTTPTPKVAKGQPSTSPITDPNTDTTPKLAVVVKSEKDAESLNQPAQSESSTDQEKSTTPGPITLPAPDENIPKDANRKKKNLDLPTIIAAVRSSLQILRGSDLPIERSEKMAPSNNEKLVSKVSPVEQINVAPASAADAAGSTASPVQDTTIPTTTQTSTNVVIPAATEMERKNQAKRQETTLTSTTEKPFAVIDDLKTTTPRTIVVAQKIGKAIVADVVPIASYVDQVKFDIAPAQTPEEVTADPSPTTTTSKTAAPAKEIMMAASQQSETTISPSITLLTVKSAEASAAPAEVPILRFGFPEITRREIVVLNQAEAQVPIVKRETGKLPTHLLEAEVTIVDGEEVEEAPSSNIETDAITSVVPAKQVEKEDSVEEQEEVEEPDQAPASKVSHTAASHVEENVDGAPTDNDSKDDSLSKLVKKQTSSHGKHIQTDEVEADEDNMAPGNKAGEESDEEEEEVTTTGSTGGAVAPGKRDVGEDEDDETKRSASVSENEEEEEDEMKENVKREDSEATLETVDDSPKSIAEGLSSAKAHASRGDSGGGGAGIEGGGLAEGGDVNQSEGSKSKVVLVDVSPGKKGSDEDDDDDDEEDDDEEDEEEETKSESPAPAESIFSHHGKHSTGRKRRELSDEKILREENFAKAKLINELLHRRRNKRSSDMRPVLVDGKKVYVDNPLEFNAPANSFDGIADGEHLMLNNGMPRRTRQTGSGYDAFPQNVGSDKFPHPFCELERDSGIICPGVRRGIFLEQFYYDSETNRCSHFVYNGCGGNANRFSTLWECNQFCGKQQQRSRRMDNGK